MTKFILSKEWAFACQNPQKIPQYLNASVLEDWLKKHTPAAASNLKSPCAFLRSVDELYPQELIGFQSPPVLFYQGNLTLLRQRKISVIGTRKCSLLGMEFTKKLSSFLRDHSIVSVSGLAYGIDEIVHQQAPERTIGILPCGFGNAVPTRIQKMCQKIIDAGGLILSEFAPDTPPRKWRFIQRNRIVAWLGEELIVVEAPQESGTLHTVKYAMDRDKKIWVVPSSPLLQSNRGGLSLIAAGFPSLCSVHQLAVHLEIPYEQEQALILSFSEFAQHGNMSTVEATKALTKMQLNGTVTPLQNGYFVWNPS